MLTIFYRSTSTHNHSISDVVRDWSKRVHFSRSWTNVARPCSCLRRTQLVGSPVELTSVQTCSGSPRVG